MQYRFTAICRDNDSQGEYRHIVRRPVKRREGDSIFYPTAKFTFLCNKRNRRAPATNPGWDS